MKILILTNMYPTLKHPYYGIFIQDHVETLRKLGVQVEVFFTNPKLTRAAYVTEIPHLVRKLATERYDVLHAHHSYCLYQLAVVRQLLRYRAPVLLTTHEGEAFLPEDLKDPEADFLKQLIYSKRLKRWALQMADLVVSVERRLPLIVGYRGPYEVIPPGVDIELFRPMDRMPCRRTLGLPEHEQIIFFPANPGRGFNKGYELVQRALTYLTHPVHLVTGGSIPHDQMPLYMNAADAVVQTSRFEASPMVVKEAMACNRPLVSTNVGDVSEIFGGTPGCFICDTEPRDVAEKIKGAFGFDERMIQGRARVLELGLTLEQTARKYLLLYQRATRQEGGTASAS